MTIAIGESLGPYRVLEKIGEGGMGEVYLARDAALGRDVALKVLPRLFLSSADRVARFEREARVLASLSHANIAGIYGLEHAGESNVLVLEFVPGDTLADRILAARGPLPLDDTLRIARQIADALGAAHEKGIVHRDLKPANIKVTADDQVKVLDFGLAKMIESDERSGGSGEASALSRSPTLTTPAMTGAGVVLGTAAYMAPEQARGKPVDKRADIWAFGCVLYEMITGSRPFVSAEVSDTLALILTKEIDWTAVPAGTPAPLRRLLRRCLEKDRARRLADIADARLEIDEASSAGPDRDSPRTATPPPAKSAGSRIAWLVAAAAIVAAALATLWRPAVHEPASAPAVRVRADLGIPQSLTYPVRDVAISPDGSAVAFVAGAPPAVAEVSKAAAENTPSQLYVRPFTQLQATAVPGTDGATRPFFSPDGRWVAFFADRKLKKVSTAGGPVATLCDAPSNSGGTWTTAGTVVFQGRTGLGVNDPLTQVADSGGAATPLFQPASPELQVRWPQMLPGGRAVLATAPVSSGAMTFNDANIVVVSLPSGARKTIQRGYNARYVPSGHLVYIHDGTLFAQTFDVNRLETSGAAVPVLQDVRFDAGSGTAEFSVSDNGTLVYLSGLGVALAQKPGFWLEKSGKTSTLWPKASTWGMPRFSPDGRRVAFSAIDNSNADIWVYEWERDTLVRLTSNSALDAVPIWSPDGRWIAYGSSDGVAASSLITNLFARRSDGTGDAIRLTSSPVGQLPDDWHPSGKVIAFHEGNPQTGQQAIMTLPVAIEGGVPKAGAPSVFLKGSFLASMAAFSPDGRWIAYVTNESGVFDVYVRPFPGPGSRWQISSGGGNSPRWSATRHELVFHTLQTPRLLRAVPYTIAGETFEAGRAAAWTDTAIDAPPFWTFGVPWDLHPDGNRAVVSLPSEASATASGDDNSLNIVFNVFDELRRLAPLKK